MHKIGTQLTDGRSDEWPANMRGAGGAQDVYLLPLLPLFIADKVRLGSYGDLIALVAFLVLEIRQVNLSFSGVHPKGCHPPHG